jgi:hypothetical protein
LRDDAVDVEAVKAKSFGWLHALSL